MTPDAFDDPMTLRARSLGDLVHLVPTLLGFHPRESLVVIVASGGRVRVTARVDLDLADDPDALAAALAPLWVGPEPGLAVAVAFGDPGEGFAALDAVGEALPAGWELEVALVSGGRWCEPWSGRWQLYDPAASPLTAEAVYHGRALLPDRDTLAASLGDGGGPGACDALRRVLDRPHREIVEAGIALWSELSAQPRDPDADEAALLAVAAFAPALVHEVLAALDRRSADRQRALWTGVVRGVPVPVGVAATGLLGIAGWVDGDGALANVCLERAAPWGDQCPWFDFLEAVTRQGVSPEEWPAVRGHWGWPRAA